MRCDALVGESRADEPGLGPGASSKDALLGRARPSGRDCPRRPVQSAVVALTGSGERVTAVPPGGEGCGGERVRPGRLELPRVSPQDPKSAAPAGLDVTR